MQTTHKKPTKKITTYIKPPQKYQLHLKHKDEVVVSMYPFHFAKSNHKTILKNLKKKLVTSSVSKEEILELQGDVLDKLRIQIKAIQYRLRK